MGNGFIKDPSVFHILIKGAVGGALIFLTSASSHPLSIAWSLQDKDMRVVDQTVGDRCSHSGGIKYFSPIGKRQIRG